jgi:Skp family chaperone for outer membrane proteins
VRTLLACATVVATLTMVCAFAYPAQAQVPAAHGANADKYGIAVVDIAYIFKKYNGFTARMEQMKLDVEAAEGKLREDRGRIQAMEEELKSYNAGSPEFKRLDEQVTEEKSDFNLRATKQRKEFLEREARIYYTAYQEITDAVKYYAQRHNIGLVLRFNGEASDPNNRPDVLRAINKAVMFQNNIDITPEILRALDRDPRVSQNPGQPQNFQNQVPVRRPR